MHELSQSKRRVKLYKRIHSLTVTLLLVDYRYIAGTDQASSQTLETTQCEQCGLFT